MTQAHKHSVSLSQNQKALLANAYNELGKELSSPKIKVVGNYTLGRVIGEGAYGVVRLGTHRLSSTRVAIKQIPKAMTAPLTREIHHHRRLHHPHVAQLFEVIATESHIWLVTELCSGGELFDYLVEKGRLSEDETRVVFGQLCLAVGYIHEVGVVHRDLKLENVLLDERCRVKLSDFGFTREYEKGCWLETVCGTTGYASPEMLQGKKYLGPEVDIWSLGVILYCLLTGTLPFDDDDEDVMREKIIAGNYEDPEWLTQDARNLLMSILQRDPIKRPSISEILAHRWFTHSTKEEPITIPLVASPVPLDVPPSLDTPNSPDASPASFHSASSQFTHSTPPTTDECDISLPNDNSKDLFDVSYTPRQRPFNDEVAALDMNRTTESFSSQYSQQSRPPSSFPSRTPARTKRRSVSSVRSQPPSPVSETPTVLPMPDFASLLKEPAPLLFSTPLERSLLNSLSSSGFDTGQMVHSVLSDACDAAGALWWMLKRKAEKKAFEEVSKKANVVGVTVKNASDGTETEVDAETDNEHLKRILKPEISSSPSPSPSPSPLPLEPLEPGLATPMTPSKSAPQLTLVPATPTAANPRPVTPPNSKNVPYSLLNATPTPSTVNAELISKSMPSTPGSSLRSERDYGSKGKQNGKPRSGSVSIMQRATTALEAAGLVRKKSAEVVKAKEEKEKDAGEKEEKERRPLTAESRSNNSSEKPNRLTKSPPPLKAPKDAAPPSTPEKDCEHPATSLHTTSPWVIPSTSSVGSLPEVPTPSDPQGENSSAPTPTLGSDSARPLPNVIGGSKLPLPGRNRGSILSTFKMWFNEDRKAKRKNSAPVGSTNVDASSSQPSTSKFMLTNATPARNQRTVNKNRNSGSGTKHRGKRPSVSSRRSSSVNSRRSSVASVQMMVLESPIMEPMSYISRQRSDPSRRSFTPNSEMDRGEQIPSRPSSVHSMTINTSTSAGKGRHRKSPSTSSAGSGAHRSSPMQKFHRRAGSGGSSTTRVVRQTKHSTSNTTRGGGQWHMRSNSTTSSLQSNSRPGSFYDASEGEGQRTNSPLSAWLPSSLDESTPKRAGSSVLVAQKKQTPFMSPSGGGYANTSFGRSSWRKAWGIEPPGWQSRSTRLPVEVLVISPIEPLGGIRDVFSGRPSMSQGDESDWVDEDDDIIGPSYAGGLGQTHYSAAQMQLMSGGVANFSKQQDKVPPLTFSHPPPSSRGKRSNRNGKMNESVGGTGGRTPITTGRGGRSSKSGQSPVATNAPLPGDNGNPFDVNSSSTSDGATRIGGRRQLPATRPGPAFRGHAIQEEDEDEE